MRSLKKYLFLMQIIFILLLFVFSSEVFAKISDISSDLKASNARDLLREKKQKEDKANKEKDDVYYMEVSIAQGITK